ncbi:hypothetical protein UNSWDHB_705 [Dehalobacter sp. UNSWDHB]|nr:hypothetical protein DHBDCA_p609 [Dehalobacter sp. DCA]AFV04674.1 hypothetical protein DCF50_p667 [Dehalobacter sp. CF]EQB21961.1 hypothetical protein UNSWDHB_705 [Dehalobacter sp. UNSWDHB]
MFTTPPLTNGRGHRQEYIKTAKIIEEKILELKCSVNMKSYVSLP